jgi:hypothetical protein
MMEHPDVFPNWRNESHGPRTDGRWFVRRDHKPTGGGHHYVQEKILNEACGVTNGNCFHATLCGVANAEYRHRVH